MQLMSIGQFAQATGLTVKRLRHYHDTGVITAARIDEHTGYRWYSPDQVADAVVLATLRDSGVGLQEIGRILGSAEDRTQLVADALGRTRADLEAARDRVARATHLLGAFPDVPFAVRWVTHRHVLVASAELSLRECSAWFGETYPQLAAAANGVTGTPGAFYANEFFTEGRGTVTAFLPVPQETPDATVLPGGHFAVAVHDGAYDTFRATYAALGAQVHHHLTPDTATDVREHYLISPSESPDPHTWRSELHWPIHPPTRTDAPGRE